MENKEIIIDDVQYTFEPSNFLEAKKHAFNIMALLKGAISVKGGDFDIDVGTVLNNIGSPEMQGVESFIVKYLKVSQEGEAILFKDATVANKHFNNYRSHYLQIIFEGVKYHFLPFLPIGAGSFINMDLAEVMKSLAQ